MVIALLVAALIAAGLAGTQETSENLLPTFFWPLIWVVVPISCGLVADWTQHANPFAGIGHLADRDSVRDAICGGSQQVGTTGYKIDETIAFVLLLLVIWAILQSLAYAVDRVCRLQRGSVGALAGLLPSTLPIAFGHLSVVVWRLAHAADRAMPHLDS